jgi:hypothetical protein
MGQVASGAHLRVPVAQKASACNETLPPPCVFQVCWMTALTVSRIRALELGISQVRERVLIQGRRRSSGTIP